jgi:hypothetical protein
MAEGLSQKILDDQYGRVDFKQTKGIDNSGIASEVIRKAKGGKMAEKWIQKAIKKPGALRAQLGAKEGKPIPANKLAAAAKKPGKLGQRARLAQTLKKMK